MTQLLSPKQRGDMARQAREAQGQSQKEIAQRLGTSQTTLHKMECGTIEDSKHWPRLFTLLKLPLEQLDPIYAALATADALHIAGHGVPEAESTVPSGRVRVQVEREAIVLAGVRYAPVQTPDGPAILITWIGRNGEEIDALMDRTMIEVSMHRWAEVAQRLGIDLARSSAPPPPR